ncbi:MAG: hypothetical protein ACPIOQ_46060 [Promethearchaeia archaeon]
MQCWQPKKAASKVLCDRARASVADHSHTPALPRDAPLQRSPRQAGVGGAGMRGGRTMGKTVAKRGVGWRVRGEWHIRAWRAPKNGHAMRAILAATRD